MPDQTPGDRRFRANNRRETSAYDADSPVTEGEPTSVANREGAVAAREGVAAAREGAATVREDVATDREGSATAREGAATVREDVATDREGSATAREGAARVREDVATGREGSATAREGAARAREDVATDREGVATGREEAARLREEAAHLREEAADLGEETSRLREEAVRAREDAAHARSELELFMAQLREANGRLIAGTVRAQAMTEDAIEASHLKDEFLATVSHELRTPLNAVLGWARMLASKSLRPEGTTRAIASIERNAAALAHIINDLLDVSRIVAGTLHVTPQPVDLVAITQVAIDAIRPLAIAKSISLEFAPHPPSIAAVSGDAIRLQQVVWNLLANAIKFTPEGGSIGVFIQRQVDQMELRITDTGIGISPAFLPHVFDRFRQADGSTTRRHSGLGLGLAIVRQLVELHGGTVAAASEGEGHGAAFTVRLPISTGRETFAASGMLEERRTETSTASPEPRLTRLDGIRLLIVDDSADGRALTSLMLTQAGASVRAVGSVRDALQSLEVQRPDALVSDIGIPDQDGYALIRQIRLREAEHGGMLPAVAVTGYARAEDRARILAAGFQAHVPKPVEAAELTAAIAAVTRHLRSR